LYLTVQFVKCKVDVTLDREAFTGAALASSPTLRMRKMRSAGLKPYGLLKIDIHGNAGSGTARPRFWLRSFLPNIVKPLSPRLKFGLDVLY
jgi:hypothetical protein